MAVYAKNKDAVAICNRSGQKMMRADMVEDGYLRGLLVHPDWYDPYHPQERPFDPDEGIAIYRPAPDLVPSPPAPVLGNISPAGGLQWTQQNPPASTVVNWQVWRSVTGPTGNFVKIATVTPTPPPFTNQADLIALDGTPNAGGIVNAANMNQQTGTFVDPGLANGYSYYIQTQTADTSNTQSPNQPPNGLISAPSNIRTVNVQTFSGNGSFNVPVGFPNLRMRGWGGGGGGNSGEAPFSNDGGGGAGGSGGGYFDLTVAISTLPASLTVTVGTGGTGGPATTAGNSGNTGNTGNLTKVTWGAQTIQANGGNVSGGAGGTATSTVAGATLEQGATGGLGGPGAGQGGAGPGKAGGNSTNAGPGGGGGGGESHNSALDFAGGVGGLQSATGLHASTGGTGLHNSPTVTPATSTAPGAGGGGGGGSGVGSGTPASAGGRGTDGQVIFIWF